MSDIAYQPRTGEEMQKATGAPVVMYSALCQQMKKEGAVNTLLKNLGRGGKCVLLLQNPKKMNSGHWTSISINPNKCELYFFSSYGGKPDEEKNKWIDVDGRLKSEQETNPLNDALKQFKLVGWDVFYNDFPYQRELDPSDASCGVWTAAFLNSGMNPDQFARFNRSNHMTAEKYYRMYFQ